MNMIDYLYNVQNIKNSAKGRGGRGHDRVIGSCK
jgi:hypothetical protein